MALERKAGFQSAIATDAGDTAAGYLTPDRYNLAHTVAGATSGGIPYFDSTTSEASSAMLASGAVVIGGGAGAAPSTTTTGTGVVTAIGNAVNTTGGFPTVSATLTSGRVALAGTAGALIDDSGLTYSGTGSTLDLAVGRKATFPQSTSAGVVFGIGGNLAQIHQAWNSSLYFGFGAVAATHLAMDSSGIYVRSNGSYRFSSSATDPYATQSGISQASANSLLFGGSTLTAGAATTRTEINKAVASIADNTATATFTVTVPNAAHSAMLKVTLVGSLGAGGAVGAREATGTISYDFAITRTAGVATVVGTSTAYGSTTAAVAGAATITVTAAASAMTGANSATQTFTINVTIARGSGSSDNHTCLCYGRLLNASATGVTIA